MQANEPDAWAATVGEIAVIGAGNMGEGIAQSFAEAGIAVRLIDITAASLDRCMAQIDRNIDQAIAAGVRGGTSGETLSQIRCVVADDPVAESAGVPFIIETVPEILDLKRRIFSGCDRLPNDVIIASNTSSMTLDAICEGMTSAHRAVGVHYFNPAHLIPGVELHRARDTSAYTVARARALVARTGKIPFLVEKAMPGLVINRLTGALMREIGHLLDEGVISPEDLDAGVKSTIGFRMAWLGPMEGSDFTGLDTGARVQTALFPTLSNRTEPSQQLVDRVARGELGLKTLRGWYSYTAEERDERMTTRNYGLLSQLRMFHASKRKPQ